jgi:hypothetical protein
MTELGERRTVLIFEKGHPGCLLPRCVLKKDTRSGVCEFWRQKGQFVLSKMANKDDGVVAVFWIWMMCVSQAI